MWQLLHPVIRAADFKLTAPDGGQVSVTQLWQDDVRLINALESVHWYDPHANFQFELCETCGYPGCQPQGWVSIRRLGDVVGILPAFQRIAEASASLKQEYLPPVCLQSGAIWVEQSDYQDLRKKISFPDFNKLSNLTAWEAAKLLQWEVPHQVLGDIHSSPQLPNDLVIASSEGSFLEQVPIFSGLLTQLLATDTSVIIQKIQPHEQVIAFYLDLASIPQWNALVYNGECYQLYLEPGFTVSVSQV
ncbi:MAG: hypothetical protein F6K11_08715 [Leptolyngbya sp. SIO3F4]|nr:hypothetical protein [Leptolyngbya sp. SIO3F4]